MFRSDQQLARVCRALCARVGLGELWTSDGPTERAIALLEAGGGPLSSGERIVLLTSWAVWNSDDGARVADVIHRLDNRNLHAIGTLILAVSHGTHAIDEWLEAMEQDEGARASAPADALTQRHSRHPRSRRRR